jgi:hypothetical protein
LADAGNLVGSFCGVPLPVPEYEGRLEVAGEEREISVGLTMRCPCVRIDGDCLAACSGNS